MEIQFSRNLALTVASRLGPAALPWAVNDVLVAKVVGRSEQNFTRLAIGDRQVLARTEALLTPGQSLTLKVASLGRQPVLAVLSGAPPTPVAGSLERGLARVLPRQASAADTRQLLQDMTKLAKEVKTIAARLGTQASSALRADLDALQNALPTLDDVTDAPRLRAVVTAAARPTEARVWQALSDGEAPDIRHDLRAQLARVGADLAALPPHARQALQALSEQLAPVKHAHSTASPTSEAVVPTAVAHVERALPDIKSLVESVVARLEATQLQNSAAGATQAPLMVELPVARGLHTDLLHLEVEHDARRDNEPHAARTSVTLNLRLGEDTEFTARLQLAGETLSLRLGSSDLAYNAELERRVGELETGLLAAGLELGAILLAPLTLDTRPRLGAHQLINERI